MLRYLPIILFTLVMSFFQLDAAADANPPKVIVSIAPHRYFVKRIADDTVDVIVLVPPGASSHTYEPTPKQMISCSKADIWFRLGEGFEKRGAEALQNFNPKMEMVNLREGVKMIGFDKEHEGHHHACCYSDFEDIHIWLSVREAKAQAINIAKALQRHYPQNAALYEKNLQKFLEDLDDTDKQMTEIFKEGPKVIMVSHPAYGYLARDYNFALLSVEFEGKDPTPKQLTEVLKRAKEEHIQKVFVQPQHSSKGARLIAQKLGAEVVDLDPFSEDYLNNMLKIAKEFASSKK